MYISFNNGGIWSDAVNMGETINQNDYGSLWPYVSTDGRHLFFCAGWAEDLGFNPYWVTTSIIDSLRSAVIVPVAIQSAHSQWRDGFVELGWVLTDIHAPVSIEIYRRETPDGWFGRSDDAAVTEAGGRFAFRDETVERGNTYTYRVVITEEGDVVASFETTAIAPLNLLSRLTRTTPIRSTRTPPSRFVCQHRCV